MVFCSSLLSLTNVSSYLGDGLALDVLAPQIVNWSGR